MFHTIQLRIYKTLWPVFFRNFHKYIVCINVGGVGIIDRLGSLGFAPFNGFVEISLLTSKETILAMLA